MIQSSKAGASIRVWVQPGATSDQVVGRFGDSIRLRVTAPPQAGQANAAVVALLAETLGVSKSLVRIVRGHSSRNKLLVEESLTQAQVDRRLNSNGG